jgi:hypothetical protein
MTTLWLKKNREYRVDLNNLPCHSISVMLAVASIPRLTVFTVSLCAFYFCRLIGIREPPKTLFYYFRS